MNWMLSGEQQMKWMQSEAAAAKQGKAACNVCNLLSKTRHILLFEIIELRPEIIIATFHLATDTFHLATECISKGLAIQLPRSSLKCTQHT